MSFNRIKDCLTYIRCPQLIKEFIEGEFDDELVENDIHDRDGEELKNILPTEKYDLFIAAFKDPEKMKENEMEIVKIIEFQTSSPYFRLNEEKYEEILKRSDGMKIGFVSIVGSPDTENTFFINYLMRYLKERVKGNDHWHKENEDYDSPLEGFPWGKAASSTTPGVWITSIPFIIEETQPIAIYVTHTTFISPIETHRLLNERMAFLQLLTSSLTIYSFPENNYSFELPLAMDWANKSPLNLGHLFYLVKSSEEDIAPNMDDFLIKIQNLKDYLNIFISIDGLTISRFPSEILKRNCKGSLNELMDSALFISELENAIFRILDKSKFGKGLIGLAKQFFNESISNSNYLELLEVLIADLNTPLIEKVDLNSKSFNTLVESLIKYSEKEVKDFYKSTMEQFRIERKFVDEQTLTSFHEETKRRALEILKMKLGHLLEENMEDKFRKMDNNFNATYEHQKNMNVNAKNAYIKTLVHETQSEFGSIAAQFKNLSDREFLNKLNNCSLLEVKENKIDTIYQSLHQHLSEKDKEIIIALIKDVANKELDFIEIRELEMKNKIDEIKAEDEKMKREEADRLVKLKNKALETLSQNLEMSIRDFKIKASQIELSLDFEPEIDKQIQLAISNLKQPELVSDNIFNQKKIEFSYNLKSLKSQLEMQFNKRKQNNLTFIENEYERLMLKQMHAFGKEYYDENEINDFNLKTREVVDEFLFKPNQQILTDFKNKLDEKYQLIKEQNFIKKQSIEKQNNEKKIEAEKAELYKKEIQKVGHEINAMVNSIYTRVEGMIIRKEIIKVNRLNTILSEEVNEMKEKLDKISKAYKSNEIQLEIEKAKINLELYINNGKWALELSDLVVNEAKLKRHENEIETLANEHIQSEFGNYVEKGEKFDNLIEEFEIKCKEFQDNHFNEFIRQENIIKIDEIERLRNKMRNAFDLKLVAYVEQNQMNAAKNSPVVGIDFGTSFTSCSIYQDGKCVPIKIDQEKEMSPTIVAYIIPGRNELDQTPVPISGCAALNQAEMNPENTIFEPKRILARLFDDPQLQQDMKYWQTSIIKGKDDGRAMIKLSNGQLIDPKDVAVLILKKVRAEANKYCNSEVTFVVITIPIKASNEYRDVMYDAAFEAGFREINFMREPVAAAVSYRMNLPEMRGSSTNKIMVFDFGGGTLDICIFNCDVNTLKVVETGGDQHFGGKNFDNAIFDYFISSSLKSGKNYLEHKYSFDRVKSTQVKNFERRLLNIIEHCKIDLSIKGVVDIKLDNIEVADKIDIKFKLTREIFEKANEENFNKIKTKLDRLFFSKKVEKSEISHVIMVGGMSNVPKVKSIVLDFFGGPDKIKLVDDKDKQLAISNGAARHSTKLFGQVNLGEMSSTLDKYKLEDIVPAAIGMGYVSGEDRLLKIVIPRNSVIPFEAKIDCTTDSNKQPQVFVPLYEEKVEIDQKRILTNDERLSSLGSFTLKTTGKEAGLDQIDIYLYYDANLIIRVEAVNQTNGMRQALEIESVFAVSKRARENLEKRIRLPENDEQPRKPKPRPRIKTTKLLFHKRSMSDALNNNF